MSPTRYSDPVTSTCTRRPLPSALSSLARLLICSTAARSRGTTADAVEGGRVAADADAPAAAPTLAPSALADVPPKDRPAEPSPKPRRTHPACFLARSSHVLSLIHI